MQDYYEFWNIKRPVFAVQDLEKDFFISEGHQGIFKRVMFFCQQGSPLLLVNAETGNGKTTLARWIYDQLPTDSHEVLIINLLQPPDDGGWLLEKVAQFFGLHSGDHMKNALSSLDELIEEDKKLLVIVDNAQHLNSTQSLDEIASLMQLQSLSQNHLSFLLLSDRPIKEKLKNHALGKQINFSAEISRLSLDECRSFLQFQLQNQGLQSELFSDDAIFILHEISKGVFRTLATIAENCLMEAFINEERAIRPTAVIKAASYVVGEDEKVLRDKFLPKQPTKQKPKRSQSTTAKNSKKTADQPEKVAPPTPNIKLTDLLVDNDAS